jgi:hypothetical protein
MPSISYLILAIEHVSKHKLPAPAFLTAAFESFFTAQTY